ncbi:cardiotrophin-2-like [Spea bombifrons]|uniref:cardiotrophin-2-like n=1 Tax=Spea bombifrons TaxID=233779 RepID=UPI0023499B23|nr:cardiotrophin-2-like [Spea bombifrons]
MLAGTVLVVLGAALCRGQDAVTTTTQNILTQIQNQAVYLHNNATLLLSIYLKYQGAPFNSSEFSFPSWQEPGLPPASLGFKKWRCLCPGERLVLDRDAFSAISEFFQLVLDDQLSLNPQAKELLQMLDAAQISSEAVLSNLLSALDVLGFRPSPAQPEFLSWASAGAKSFQKKVRGYVLCREYKDWLARVANDMMILKGTRGGREAMGQERRGRCRS